MSARLSVVLARDVFAAQIPMSLRSLKFVARDPFIREQHPAAASAFSVGYEGYDFGYEGYDILMAGRDFPYH